MAWQAAHVSVSQQPRSASIDAGTVDIHYLEYGDPDAPPLVVLHGHTDSAWSWHHLSERFADRRRVVAMDLRGHGDSGRGAPSAQHMVGDVLGLIERLDLGAPAILAHSLGGHVASMLAGVFPHRVSRLVMVEALGPPRLAAMDDAMWRDVVAARVDAARAPARRRVMPDLDDAVRRFVRQNPGAQPGLLEPLVPRLVNEVDGGFEWKFDPLTRDWIATHDHERAETMWRGIQCPVLHVLGADAYERFWSKVVAASDKVGARQEPMSPAELQRRLDCFTDQRCIQVPDCGHMVHYEQPDALYRAAADFLDVV